MTTVYLGGQLYNDWTTTGGFSVTESLTVNGSSSLKNLTYTGHTIQTSGFSFTFADQGAEFINVSNNTSALTQGYCYYLNSSGAWVEADATTSASSINFLAIAQQSNSNNGMLYRGMMPLISTYFSSNPNIGVPIYLSETSGRYSINPPSTSGSTVRLLGHIVDQYSIALDDYFVLYFNPSPDYIILS